MVRRKFLVAFLVGIFVAAGVAKEPVAQTVDWPETGKPVLRFAFGKLKEVGTYGRDRGYTCETTAQNLWDKKISTAIFTLYIFDKTNVRIGEGFVQVNNVAPGELIKFQTSFHATGAPATFKLVAQTAPAELQPPAPPRTINITINSVPQGASLKVDGTDAGTTPKIVRIAPGRHTLEFAKEGFNPGKFPLEIGPDDASGGSVSYELGTSAHDTIELRDGSVMTCDVESMSATEVVISLGGTRQRLNRNLVKRMLLVERDPPPGK